MALVPVFSEESGYEGVFNEAGRPAPRSPTRNTANKAASVTGALF